MRWLLAVGVLIGCADDGDARRHRILADRYECITIGDGVGEPRVRYPIYGARAARAQELRGAACVYAPLFGY